MSQALTVDIRGLYTFPSDLSSVPAGSLSTADNIVIDRDSIAEPRHGFGYLPKTSGRANFDSGEKARRIFLYKDTIWLILKNGSNVYRLVYFDSTDGWKEAIDPLPPPSSSILHRYALSNGNMYVTAEDGVYRLDSKTSVPVRAGVPEGIISNVRQFPDDPPGSTRWFLSGKSVNYRIVWGYKDLNGNLYLGAPSILITVTNSGGNGDVVLTLPIPNEIVTAYASNIFYFYQIYRSAQVTGTPDDELRLVIEQYPTSAEITAEEITAYDVTPEALRIGAPLYTNASQEGIGSANIIPPKALDIAVYKNCMFYANVRSQQIFLLTLTSAGRLSAGDTITFGTEIYTAVLSPTVPSAFEFLKDESVTVSDAIRITAINLIGSINTNSVSYYATYASGDDDLPGKILVKTDGINDPIFYVSTSNPLPWIPALPTSGDTVGSDDGYQPNGISYSKYSEPEAVPLINNFTIGSRDSAILRILPLRDSLFVLKEDGVFRIYGDYPNFAVVPLDTTVEIVAPDSAVVLNNEIYAFTKDGVVIISESGVEIISRPIERDIIKLLALNPSVVSAMSFGVAYDTEKTYYLWLPTDESSTYCDQYYRFNTVTKNWTRGTLGKYCGGVDPYTDKLYLGDTVHEWLDRENKNYENYDYADYVNTYTISVVSGKTVSISTAPSVGQLLYQEPSFSVRTVTTGGAGGFDHTNDTITKTAHGYKTGTRVVTSINSGSFPAGLSARTYYIFRTSDDTFKLCLTWADAMSGTLVTFTDNGDAEAKTVTFTPSNRIVYATVAEANGTDWDMEYEAEFYIGECLVLQPIDCTLRWNVQTFGNPGMSKHVSEVSLLFLSDFYGTGTVDFKTDVSAHVEEESAIGSMAGNWGRFPWGQFPWGGSSTPLRRPLRVAVPRNHQRASVIRVGFNHSVCFSPWALQGISYIGRITSPRIGKETHR